MTIGQSTKMMNKPLPICCRHLLPDAHQRHALKTVRRTVFFAPFQVSAGSHCIWKYKKDSPCGLSFLYGPSESTNPGPHAVSRARNVKNAQTNVQTVQDKGLCLVTLTGVI